MVFLYAGKLQPKKNPSLLIDAFSALKDGSHLVFVGNGELEVELKRKAETIENVHFMPFQNQSVMPAVYRLGDVFVLSSHGPEETWGWPGIEPEPSAARGVWGPKVTVAPYPLPPPGIGL